MLDALTPCRVFSLCTHYRAFLYTDMELGNARSRRNNRQYEMEAVPREELTTRSRRRRPAAPRLWLRPAARGPQSPGPPARRTGAC